MLEKNVLILSDEGNLFPEVKGKLEKVGIENISCFNCNFDLNNYLVECNSNNKKINIVIYIDEKFNIKDIRKINEICINNNIAFLPLEIYDDFFEMGPLVLPHETACFECYWSRLQIPKEIKENFYFNNFSSKLNREISPLRIINREVALNFLSYECLSFLDNSFGIAKTIGNKLLFNPFKGKIIMSSVVEVPNCIVCNTRGDD